jgi:hypothetical protein
VKKIQHLRGGGCKCVKNLTLRGGVFSPKTQHLEGWIIGPDVQKIQYLKGGLSDQMCKKSSI